MQQGYKHGLGSLFYVFYYQYLLRYMKTSPNKHLRYVQHSFNISKSKSAFSFSRSGRFVQDKTFSPNKFYDLPSTLSQKASRIGFGNKTNFEKADFVEPGRYRISSDFEKTASQKPKANSTFGISRQEYYKGKLGGNKPGPGTYQISSKQKNRGGYMGYRYEPPTHRHNASACSYDIRQGLEKLSNFRNTVKDCRMKTEYCPKPKYYENKTHTPGPGSYQCQAPMNNSHNKSKPYLFGKEEKLKKDKISKTGPGSYHIFSQFGFQ